MTNFFYSTLVKTPFRECKALCVTDSSFFVGGDFSSPDILEFSLTSSNPLQFTHIGTFSAHTGFITKLIHVPQRFLLSSSGDRTIIQWDLTTKNPLLVFTGHKNVVSSISFDGTYLYSCSWDNEVRKWDVTTGSCLAVISGHSLSVLDVLALGKDFCLSCSADKSVKLWNNSTPLAEYTGHPDVVRKIRPTPESGVFVSVGNDGALRFWNMETSSTVDSLYIHEHFVYALECVAYHCDSPVQHGSRNVQELVVSGGEDQLVKVTWNRKERQTLSIPQVVYDLAVTRDGLLLVATADGNVYVFTLKEELRANPTMTEAYDEAVRASFAHRAQHSG
ncbi:hypothetical protein RCL1_006060 [Eukaryota sp. TZLM3-RCL]